MRSQNSSRWARQLGVAAARGWGPRAGRILLAALLAGLSACAPLPAQTQAPNATEAPSTAPGAAAPEATAQGAAPQAGSGAPGDYLDLSNWKLTLPVGNPGSPTEVHWPELRTFVVQPYFYVAAGKGVVFQAHAGGVTTPHSSYPRSELREMAKGGKDKAAWSTTVGRHTMTITEAITHVPVAKPHVVAAQVHDAKDDILMIRLERDHLFVEGGGNDLATLDPSYQLGTPFTVRLDASGGRIRVYYNDMNKPKLDVERVVSGCYFKAGAYTQSNPKKGDDANAYGQVVISQISVTHE